MAKVIKADGTVLEDVHPLNGKDFKLKEVQLIVGGYVELQHMRDGRVMLLDEEGKLKSKPVNMKATELLFGPEDNALARADFVVGDVLVCESKEFK